MPDTKFTILYVDDEQNNLFAFQAAFRREYRVLVAESGPDAIEILRENEVHMILTDQRMPGMTGVEFLEYVRREYPTPVRMILTGFSDLEAVIDAINEGRVYRYMTKPWDKTDMRLTLDSARDFYQLAQKNKKLYADLEQAMRELKQAIRRFKQYVPESVAQEALNASEEALLRGEKRKVAALFCDIRNFTRISDRLDPEEVVEFLNEFYSRMTEVVNRHNGTVNQFIGDEVFAVFGAPVADEIPTLNAVYCAIEMVEEAQRISAAFQDKLNEPFQIGIGINCGEVIAGNVGSEARISYAVIGDTINTAKRIESLTKPYPNAILIRDHAFEEVASFIEAKAWEPVSVKGKSEKIVVYEVLRKKNEEMG